MKQQIAKILSNLTGFSAKEIINLIEIPPNSKMGDYAFPCFYLSKRFKKNPSDIANDLAPKISNNDFEKVEAIGPYINFFVNRKIIAKKVIKKILEEADKYGSSKVGKKKRVVIEMSSPNMAKPFGIGHLRSTIIGNSLAEIYSFLDYKVVRINYLGDWGTPFGKIIAGYIDFGNKKEFKKNPIDHLYKIYLKVSKDEDYEDKGREIFKLLESNDKKIVKIWKEFRKESIKEFNKIYKSLNIKFDVISGESHYNKKMIGVLKELKKKNLLEESEGALIVNLEKYNLGMCLIQKSDGTTLYATRDIAAAIDRYRKYNFSKMIYEVGAEQILHFSQIFKILELMKYPWHKNCIHIAHGLYLDSDGKKLATRKGKTVFMEDILKETKELAKQEILKRTHLNKNELEKRSSSIALAAVLYGDLKNYRMNNMLFDIDRFVSFEGDTGPYLLYTYARAKSILSKANYKKNERYNVPALTDNVKSLIIELGKFPEIVLQAHNNNSPHVIANYAFSLAQIFNEFYHSEQVIGSENEQFKLVLVDSFSQVLRNALNLLGIKTLEKM